MSGVQSASGFQAGWDSLGRENAAETLCTLAHIFRHWTVQPNKDELVSALNFLSGDSDTEARGTGSAGGECGIGNPVRRFHMSRSPQDEHTIVRSSSAVDGEEENDYRRSVHVEEESTHVVELAVSEIKMQGVFKGYFSRFLAMDRLKADVTKDSFGRLLIKNGVSKDTIDKWSVDPQVKGGSLFDALEDLDSDACLAKAVQLNKK